MRASLWIVVSLVGVGLGATSVVSCKSSSTTGTGGSTSATSATTATSSTKAATVTTSTTGATTTGTMASTGTQMSTLCNPVTGAPCNVTGGETCDLDGMSQMFVCFPPPNNVALCGACNNANGPFCAPGMHCVVTDAAGMTPKCAQFCCSDADCGGTAGSCAMGFLSSVGVCGTAMMGGTTTATASTGTGMPTKFLTPVCSGIPATPPSNGSCVMAGG